MTADSGLDFPLLEKLVEINAREPGCCARLMRLVHAVPDFNKQVLAVEEWLENTTEDKPRLQSETKLSDEFHDLYVMVVKKAPLYRMFQEEPRFSEVEDVEQLYILLAFADVHPTAGEVMFTSRDPLFNRLARQADLPEFPTAEDLFREDLAQLDNLRKKYPPIYEALFTLAENEDYAFQIARVEAAQEGRPLGENGTGESFSPTAEELLARLEAANGDDPDRPASRFFLDFPRFSEMLPEEVLQYESLRTDLPDVKGLLHAELIDVASEMQKSDLQAKRAVKELAPGDWQYIRRNYSLRREALLSFRDRREFTKIHALRLNWPELARKAQTEFSALLELERSVLAPETRAARGESLWEKYKDDRRLKRFLSLRPHFMDIDERKLREIFESATAVGAETLAPLPSEAPEPIAEPTFEALEPYKNFVLRFEAKDGEFQVACMESVAGNAPSEYVPLPWTQQELDMLFQRLEFGPTREVRSANSIRLRSIAPADTVIKTLKELGRGMYDFAFPPGPIRSLLLSALGLGGRQRFVLDIEDPSLLSLPWETLYLPDSRQHLAVSRKNSLVRQLNVGPSQLQRSLGPTLRILAVLASPEDAPPIDIEEEARVLKAVLAPAVDRGQAELVTLEHATHGQLRQSLRTFRPHTFHFVGHGLFKPGSDGQIGEGNIILEDEDNHTFLLNAEELGVMLNDSRISLAVLNGCVTGVAAAQDSMTSTAGALVKAGIPAVIATMRPVADQVALLFAREFYRALVEGLRLEEALVEARIALFIERFDWSVYALYAGAGDLDLLAMASVRLTEVERAR